MKTKRKIDQKAIQQFFIDHTEKIVIGVVGLLFVYFTYNAVMLQLYQGYKKSADDLTKATAAAQKRIHDGPMNKDVAKEAPIPPFAKMIDEFKAPLDVAQYPMPPKLDWTPIKQRRPRDTPQVFVVEKLRAVPGRGALFANQNQGGQNRAGTVGQRWVVVTGLVPNAKEIEEYYNQFHGATEDNMDPKYFGFLVQRAEVVPGESGEPKWEETVRLCYQTSFAEQFAKWGGLAPEVVDAHSTLPCLTSPLPPLANGTWGEEVAHSPEVPIAPPPPTGQGPGFVQPGAAARGRPRVAGPGGAPPVRTLPLSRGPDNVDDELAVPGDPDKTDSKSKVAEEAPPQNYLLRYFDFDVQPGKEYAYRIFVILDNPNFQQAANDLVEAELANQRWLGVVRSSLKPDKDKYRAQINLNYAKWSDSCTSPKLPGDMRLLAGATMPAKVPAPAEVTGEARVLLWGEQSGLNLNYSSDPRYRGTELSFNAEMKTPGDNHRTKINPLDTKSILVDLAGGDVLAPKDRDRSLPNLGPGMMIVLDESGNLVIHDEMGDLKEWTENTKEPERPAVDTGPRRGHGARPDIATTPSGPDGPDAPDRHRPGRGH